MKDLKKKLTVRKAGSIRLTSACSSYSILVF
jgi:hypothetical protein